MRAPGDQNFACAFPDACEAKNKLPLTAAVGIQTHQWLQTAL